MIYILIDHRGEIILVKDLKLKVVSVADANNIPPVKKIEKKFVRQSGNFVFGTTGQEAPSTQKGKGQKHTELKPVLMHRKTRFAPNVSCASLGPNIFFVLFFSLDNIFITVFFAFMSPRNS